MSKRVPRNPREADALFRPIANDSMIPNLIGYITPSGRPICVDCDEFITSNPRAHRPIGAIPITTSPEFPQRFTCKTHQELFGSVKTFVGTAESSLSEEIRQ